MRSVASVSIQWFRRHNRGWEDVDSVASFQCHFLCASLCQSANLSSFGRISLNEETPVIVEETQVSCVASCRDCHERFAHWGRLEGGASDCSVGCSNDLKRDAFLTQIRQAFSSSSHKMLAFGLALRSLELIFWCGSWRHHRFSSSRVHGDVEASL